MKLSGKVAVITGAARGIGRARAERFLDEGAKVVVSDVDADRLSKTVSEPISCQMNLIKTRSIYSLGIFTRCRR